LDKLWIRGLIEVTSRISAATQRRTDHYYIFEPV